MRKIASGLALLFIVLAIGAMPIAAHGCIVSKRGESACSCCVKKTCCSERNKKDQPATQPLATNGHEFSLNIPASFSEITLTFGRANRPLNPLPQHSGNSPPTPALLCTFLI